MNYSDLSLEELEDLMKQREDAAKIALNDLEFKVANVLIEEVRKIREEIIRRDQHGQKTV